MEPREVVEDETAAAAAAPPPTAAEAFRQAQNDLFEQQRPPPHRRRRRPVTRAGGVGGADATTASEAAEIQRTLQRTQGMLKEQLRLTETVQTAIHDDDQVLRETLDAHQSLDVGQAQRALTELERAQQKESRVLAAAIFFFWGAVFYVAWCRILIKIPFLDRVLLVIPFVWKSMKIGMEFALGKLAKGLFPLLNHV